MLFLIRISQSLASQSVTVSGTTGSESAHTHTRGTMNITGKINIYAGGEDNSNGALIYDRTGYSNNPGGGGMLGDANIQFNASKKWTGSTSAGTAHSHSFSSSATIGSGDYTRPNSTSTLIIIRY